MDDVTLANETTTGFPGLGARAMDFGRPPVEPESGLRAEHASLAARLVARGSVDRVRRAAFLGTATLFAGVAGWFVATEQGAGPGLDVAFVSLAGLAALCAALAGVELVRARRLQREEDALFLRLRSVRARLGLDR